MVLKVLLLNFPREEILKVPSNVAITQTTIEKAPTLHDFHVIILDTEEILNEKWWSMSYNKMATKTYTISQLRAYNKKLKEQTETGGIVFCFSGSSYHSEIEAYDRWVGGPKSNFGISNYFCCPIDLKVVNEKGDTFYPKFEELKYLAPLLKNISLEEITWKSYFSNVPKNSRVLGVNRAGYSVFMEVSIGAGKLVLLPRFENRAEAVTTIVNEVIPRMTHEEEFTFTPKWLPDFSSAYEKQIRNNLSQIEKAKRLLFTKDKALKKAVAFALEKLGFKVDILPDGTLPDLRIADRKQQAIIEIKGHEKRQATRREVLQLLGYLSETDVEEKGVVVCNHEFNKKPDKRSEKAFTDGAIQLGTKTDVSLVSSVNLYEVVMKILEKKLDDVEIKKARNKIMAGSGLVQL